MKHFKLTLVLFLFIIPFTFLAPSTFAQGVTQNISSVNVDDLTDSQIQQIIQQGRAAGLSDEQIVKSAEDKGMSATQADKLRQRLAASQNVNGPSAAPAGNTAGRALNYTPEASANGASKTVPGQLPIFGADLFSGSNTTFEPNIKIATPVNYILGPEDQLTISIYGNSVSNWQLTVSPEGNINLPIGGIVNVSGKTIEEATAAIKSRLNQKNYAIGSGSNLKVTLGDIRSIKVIMVGEVTRPGTYTLPSLATAFNALYAAGGPNQNGSYRAIEIIRNNRIIRHLDIYDFLVKGDQKNNIGLQDQDIIRIPTYNTRVEMAGQVKTPAVFEVLPGEYLQDVITFAGGFTSGAYRASITASQISDEQRRIIDIPETDFKNYIPLPGDRYTVKGILDRYENRVTINGAVFRPGEYQLDKGMTLLQLIVKASGLREDAFSGRGSILRLNPDNTTQLLSFDVKDIINKVTSIPLQREDVITINSIFDLRNAYSVQISGDVRNPGNFAYADSMKVEDLIQMAGGFNESASPVRVEVGRRVTNGDPSSKSTTIAKVYTIDIDPQLKLSASNFTLKPFDIVVVYSQPGYSKQGIVNVIGEVMYPGVYVIENKNEKISDIINHAGGLTAAADADGSTLKRNYIALLGVDKNKVTDTASLQQEHMQRVNQLKQAFNDTTNTIAQTRNTFIGINLPEILKNPGSVTDLIVKDGDVIKIPAQQQVVEVNGEVHVPSGVVYENGKTLREYVYNAGGFADDALHRGAYVIYPNGTVKGTHKFLFFNSYPSIKPGSEIFVPKKPLRHGLNIAEVVGLISAVGTTVILAILSFKH